jgi:hypothetical protein
MTAATYMISGRALAARRGHCPRLWMKAGSAPGWRPLPIIQICAKGASCCHTGLDAQIGYARVLLELRDHSL